MENKEKKLFSSPRWNDTSLPVVIGHTEFTPEERAANEKKAREILIAKGVIKDDDAKQ